MPQTPHIGAHLILISIFNIQNFIQLTTFELRQCSLDPNFQIFVTKVFAKLVESCIYFLNNFDFNASLINPYF